MRIIARVLAYFEDDSAVPGAVGFIQTSGELLNWRPHVHLLVADVVDNLLSWQHSGFSVHGEVRVPDREAAAHLGRYMIRCPARLSSTRRG